MKIINSIRVAPLLHQLFKALLEEFEGILILSYKQKCDD
jgi:hypothetical protein